MTYRAIFSGNPLEYAFKPFEELTKAEKEQLFIERALCKVSFPYWLRYCKIVTTPIPGQTGSGIKQFDILPHLETFISSLLSDSLISTLKSRQIRISTTLAAYVLWFAENHEGANCLLFSKGQPEAKELLAKAHRIYDQQPGFLKPKIDPDSTEELGFPSMKSAIRAFPSTSSAGISYTASIVICDEHAEHPYADENYLSGKPTRDAGGQFISVFTADAQSNDNLATALFNDARENKNGFKWHFFPYNVVPGRDRKWYENTQRSIPEREMGGLTPDLYMAKNYPRTIEEALSMPQTIAAFDHKVLDSMIEETRNPIKSTRDGIDPLIVHIYQEPAIGQFYVAASDTSHGMGKDYAVTVVMNVRTGVVVADIFSNRLSPEELALHSVRLLGLYNNPKWYPEDNDWGRVTITTAQNLGYKNIGYSDDKMTKLGWHTEEKSRTDLFGGLIPAINNHQITVYNKDGVKQFYDVIRNPDKNGRIEASGTRHDDYPMAVGIAWVMKDKVLISSTPMKPVHSLTFVRR